MTDDSDGFPDLPEVPPTQQMQELLSAYRDQTHRTSAQIESALQSVTAQVGSASAAATATGISTTGKVGLAATLLGVAGVVGLALSQPQQEPQATQAEPVAASTPAVEPPLDAPEAESVAPEDSAVSEEPPEEPLEDDSAPVEIPSQKVRAQAKATPKAKPKTAAKVKPKPTKPPPADTLADELRRLQQVRAALRAGTPARARALIESHRRDYPDSTLARERDATEVAALCAERRDADAKRKAAAFARAYPGSSQDLLADCDG